MPSALLKACPGDGGTCPELVASGRCATHQRQVEQRRGTATSRGYDSQWSKRFKPWFLGQLIKHGVAPVCGARLPGAPLTADSRCQVTGRLVGWSDGGRALELEHIVPAVRRPRAEFKDRWNLQLLCRSCHSAKTQREQQAAGVR